MPKPGSFPISPKLSHVIVANAMNKLSLRSSGSSKSFHVDCIGKSGGLLLLWNDDLEVSVKSFTTGHIDALVINGNFLNSDHRPIVATLENVTRRRRTWLSMDYPLDNQDTLIDIFGSCADQLGAWNKSKYGSIPRQVRETQKQLDDLLSVSAPLVRMEEVKRLEFKLNDLLSREECYWKLRSRADWLALGDIILSISTIRLWVEERTQLWRL
ncbi:hypothetical protein F8388_022535 [Cannabis sativa]|uniref:Endonuclease/exonuclease/phosphatase domain-containing protein n=1 Tax=Cannabis sativa TaxID=3483 RepID=A0A7J6EK02_CANSA|nr:hypothetical protein F8388_022535 [Cannabis sativa]